MLIDHAGGEFNGVTSNLSTTGFSMNLGQPLPVSMPVTGRLFPPDSHSIAFAAEVRWVRAADEPRNANETHGIGLVFLGPPQQGYGALVGVRMPTKPMASDARGRPVAQPMPVLAPKSMAKRRRGTLRRTSLRPVTQAIESLRAGQQAQTTKIIEPDDLGLTPDIGSASLSPARAAVWIERAVSLALAGVLPRGVVTLPISMEVQIAPRAVVEVGACVVTTARLVEVGSGASWLRFRAIIQEDTRQLASGTQLREVLEPKKR